MNEIAAVRPLLESEPSARLVRSVATTALQLRHPEADGSRYLAHLDQALADEPPPFATAEYGSIYRSLAVEPRWMAVSLLTNAEREGDGSRRLWSLAACATDPFHRQLLKRHACDESKHALLYLSLANLAFPGAIAPGFASELRTLSPGFSMSKELVPVEGSPYAKEPTLDDFLQMNIAEIRTTVHHTLQRKALTLHCPTEHRQRVAALQDRLLVDELTHVGYTALLIDGAARAVEDEKLTNLFARRFREFNAITTEELGGDVFDCSVACCARRPSCRAKAPGVMADHAGPVDVGLPSRRDT